MPTSQTQNQRLKQAPQKMLLSTMIEASQTELEQLIRQEVENNVALELMDPEPSAYAEGEGADDGGDAAGAYDDAPAEAPASDEGILQDSERGDALEIEHQDDDPVNTSSMQATADDEGHDIFAIAASEETFREELKQQINILPITAEERYLAHYIIDCLDEDGYLRRPLSELVDDLEFTQHHLTTEEDLEAVLVDVVQEELEPAGIGARDLRECLLLQIQEKKASPVNRLAYYVLHDAFDALADKRYDIIEERFGITSHQALVEVLRVIRHLNPKPGNMQPVTQSRVSSASQSPSVRPDFFVWLEDDEFVISLNDNQTPQVRISSDEQTFFDTLQEQGAASSPQSPADQDKREALRFMRDSMQRAQQFIDTLEQRRQTMLTVMQTILRLQREYFLTGMVESLLPMTLEDVASHCSYDISTISRVTSSKYADTPFGLIALKSLFTNAVGNSNQAAVLDALRQLLDAEDKRSPLSDQQLSDVLLQQGYSISRRTVVKYRTRLGIGSARERMSIV